MYRTQHYNKEETTPQRYPNSHLASSKDPTPWLKAQHDNPTVFENSSSFTSEDSPREPLFE